MRMRVIFNMGILHREWRELGERKGLIAPYYRRFRELKYFDLFMKMVLSSKKVCTICYDNPMDIALGCKHRICSTCEQKVYHCPHCQTPILTKLKLICGDEKFWCPICLANPKGMVFGCGHQTCLECARDLQSCPKCGSVGTPMQLY
ncbi:uncharacterized protein LOC125469900 isoform X3 [Pyrus x bretschneideri]|nr:uncharacterized protein LOC125469900 isoform X3 [Pyrus x bretschneideri]